MKRAANAALRARRWENHARKCPRARRTFLRNTRRAILRTLQWFRVNLPAGTLEGTGIRDVTFQLPAGTPRDLSDRIYQKVDRLYRQVYAYNEMRCLERDLRWKAAKARGATP